MTRTARIVACLPLLLVLFVGPAAAAPRAPVERAPHIAGDHIGGVFTACGRITFFEAPGPGSDGIITIAGSAVPDPAEPTIGMDHSWIIDEAAAVDPRVAPLAAVGAWTCLDIDADGMAVITALSIPAAHISCGVLQVSGGLTFQHASPTHEFTTVVLDGEAGAVVAADSDLASYVAALAALFGRTAEACLDFTFAVDGSVAGITLDYSRAPGDVAPAPIACGMVDGTPIPYRDPASQPYPEGDTVSVDGFEIDADLLPSPYLAMLAFVLDGGHGGLDTCLLVRIEDSVIESAAVHRVLGMCGALLEVVGGLVYVNAVLVPQSLTSVNFAEPSGAEIANVCMEINSVLEPAPSAATVVTSRLTFCLPADDVGPATFTVAGVTFFLDAPLVGEGGVASTVLLGPDPFQPFAAANPARLAIGANPLCDDEPVPDAPLPDTALPPSGSPLAVYVALAFLWLSASAGARLRRLAGRDNG